MLPGTAHFICATDGALCKFALSSLAATRGQLKGDAFEDLWGTYFCHVKFYVTPCRSFLRLWSQAPGQWWTGPDDGYYFQRRVRKYRTLSSWCFHMFPCFLLSDLGSSSQWQMSHHSSSLSFCGGLKPATIHGWSCSRFFGIRGMDHTWILSRHMASHQGSWVQTYISYGLARYGSGQLLRDSQMWRYFVVWPMMCHYNVYVCMYIYNSRIFFTGVFFCHTYLIYTVQTFILLQYHTQIQHFVW